MKAIYCFRRLGTVLESPNPKQYKYEKSKSFLRSENAISPKPNFLGNFIEFKTDSANLLMPLSIKGLKIIGRPLITKAKLF